jgi:hypothetical protein
VACSGIAYASLSPESTPDPKARRGLVPGQRFEVLRKEQALMDRLVAHPQEKGEW